MENNSTDYNPVKLNKEINSSKNETNPIVINYDNERYLYFTRSPKGNDSFNEDIYIALESKNLFFEKAVPFEHNSNKILKPFYVSPSDVLSMIFYGHYGNDLRGNLICC